MKIITFQDIANLKISPLLCYDWVDAMIKNKRQALLPPKISMKPLDGVFCNVMPSIIPGLAGTNWGGVKIVTRYPKRVPSLESHILLMNADNGEFLALMDGTWITAMRTGAVAAHSIILFGKKNFSTMGIMGLGNVVRSTLLVLANKLPQRELNIKLLNLIFTKDIEQHLARILSWNFNYILLCHPRVSCSCRNSPSCLHDGNYFSC